jgi:Flp pilus assembly protein TadG
MSEINRQSDMYRPVRTFQTGAAAVEFALLIGVFVVFVFGIIEVTRMMYIYNTLQEVTRRGASAAASTDFSDIAAMSTVQQNAIFRDSPGELLLAAPVTDKHIRIDYLALVRQSDGSTDMTPIPESSLPSCPARNRQICMTNPNATNCIRFVRVRVCDLASSTTCDAVSYQAITLLINLPVKLPTATTIAPAESLGFLPGMAPCS